MFGFKGGAEELGWTAESIDANLSPDKQVADIATMVTQGQDGIASWTLDPGAAAGAYGQAKAAGIPGRRRELRGHGHRRDGVVGDQPVRRRVADRGAHASTSREERPGAKVLEIGGPPVPSIQAYEKCFAENAKRNGLTIVGKAHNTKDTAATAQPIVADLLTKNPEVDAIWAYNDASALGASAALIADGREGLRRLGRRRDRVRPERRRRCDHGDQGASPHRDARSGPGRHRLGADQGDVRVRREGQGRRTRPRSSWSRAARGRSRTSTTTGRRASAVTRSTRSRCGRPGGLSPAA